MGNPLSFSWTRGPKTSSGSFWILVAFFTAIVVAVATSGCVAGTGAGAEPTAKASPTRTVPHATTAAGPSPSEAAPTSQAASPVPTEIATARPSVVVTPSPSPTKGTFTPSPSALGWVHMLDAKVGWGLTEKQVLRTTDGGWTWTDVSPSGPTLNAPLYLSGKLVQGRTVAWLGLYQSQRPPVLLETRDAGKHWRAVTLPAPPDSAANNISFVDRTRGWVMINVGAAAGSDEVLVLRTTDEGLTWHRVAATPPLSSPTLKPSRRGIPLGGDKTGMTFHDATTGWIAGTIATGGIYLYASHDGGRSWQRVVLGLPSEFPSAALPITYPPRFFGAKVGLLPVIVNDRTLLFYTSHDGRQNWQPTTPVRFGMTSSGRIVYDFMDPEHGWASDGRMFYQTTDGARHWTKLTPNVPLTSLTELDFVSPRVGWAILAPPRRAPRLLATNDGGTTWAAIPAQVVRP